MQKIMPVLISPFTWLIVMALAAALMVSFGIYYQYGFGFSLVSGGLFSLFYSAIIFKGLGNG